MHAKGKRAIPVYVNKPVEKDKILQLLDVARFAPNGAKRAGRALGRDQ